MPYRIYSSNSSSFHGWCCGNYAVSTIYFLFSFCFAFYFFGEICYIALNMNKIEYTITVGKRGYWTSFFLLYFYFNSWRIRMFIATVFFFVLFRINFRKKFILCIFGIFGNAKVFEKTKFNGNLLLLFFTGNASIG